MRQIFAPIILSLVLMTAPAIGAELHITDYQARNWPQVLSFTPRCNAWLTGRIRVGDAERIEAALLSFARNKSRPGGREDATIASIRSDNKVGFHALCLSGSGGDLREALKISAFFYGWATVVEEGAVCESACAVIFMKAGRRNGLVGFDYTKPGRYLHVNSKLGFHSPMLDYSKKDAMVSTKEVGDAYARALRTMRELTNEIDIEDAAGAADFLPAGRSIGSKTSFVGSTGFESFMPRDLMLAILLTPPSEMFYVTTVQQALYWGIDLIGYRAPKFISSEMLRFGCVNIINMRCESAGPFGTCLRKKLLAFSSAGSVKEFLLAEALHRFEYSQSRLWPPAGTPANGLVVHGFRYGDVDWDPSRNEAACRARIVLQDGKLTRFEIDTFNGSSVWRYLGPGNFDRLGDPLGITESVALELPPEMDYRPSNPFAARTWMMLPVSRKLSELGPDKNPWSELEESGPYLNSNVIAPISSRYKKNIETRECSLTWDGCPKQ